MAYGVSDRTLRRLGVVFLGVAIVVTVAVGGFIILGASQAISATTSSKRLMSDFDQNVCRASWTDAYSQMSPDYRSSNSVEKLETDLVPDSMRTTPLKNCEFVLLHVKRERDGSSWSAELNQHLSTENRAITNRCILKSSSSGWHVSQCNRLSAS
jgi:hypothetical protein